jgi:glycine oxidase
MSSVRSASSPDVLVVGGGIIGLSVALRARAQGLSVTLLERDRVGSATSHVAAGMLAPVAETEFGPAGRRLLDLGLRSAAMWPGFAADLERTAGVEVGLLQTGTLVVARDADEARELERQLAFRASLGLLAERLLPGAARAREPALAPTLRLALEAPDDHSVDPRLVLAALRLACLSAGVVVRERIVVEEFELESIRRAAGQRVVGVRLRGGERLRAGRAVLAAGPWSAQIGGLPAHALVPVRPVKGQILRLRDPAGPGLLTRVLRFQGGYLVPRGDGRYVLGATVEELGFDSEPTAAGVHGLLRDATDLVPGIDELRIEELSVGLRPGTPDNTPLIGPSSIPGLVLATGHYRNGILLAPLTAELVVAELSGAPARADADGGLRATGSGAQAAGSRAAAAGLKAVSA